MIFTMANLNRAKMSNKLFFSLSFLYYFLCLKNGKNEFLFFWVLHFELKIEGHKKTLKKKQKHSPLGKKPKFLNI